jgi:hypothetical protein
MYINNNNCKNMQIQTLKLIKENLCVCGTRKKKSKKNIFKINFNHVQK